MSADVRPEPVDDDMVREDDDVDAGPVVHELQPQISEVARESQVLRPVA